MNLRLNGLILFIGLIVGAFCGYKFSRPRPLEAPAATAQKKTEKKFDPGTGKLVSETTTEATSTPVPQPKPRYKITLIPTYNFLDQKIHYAGLYEKRYDIPLIREVYLGVYLSSKLEAGLSISKEFY